MRPFSAVPFLINSDNNEPLGSCFRIKTTRHFLTANHCVENICPDKLKLITCLETDDLMCTNIYRHSKADIAIIEVDKDIPDEIDKFEIDSFKSYLGMQIHSFGFIDELFISNIPNPFRVVGGIVQRDFKYDDGKYISECLEISTPIPKGMSGGPAFSANTPFIVVGISIATIISELSMSHLYQSGNDLSNLYDKIRYGIILRLQPLKPWIQSIVGDEYQL